MCVHRYVAPAAPDIRVFDRSPQLEERSRLTGRAPVKWATWSRDSPHLPAAVHTDPQSLGEVMSWLRAGVKRGEGPAAIYCLVMGMVIRDATEVQMLEPGVPLPSHLPEYFSRSCLPFDSVPELLGLCSKALPPAPGPRPAARSSGRTSLTQGSSSRGSQPRKRTETLETALEDSAGAIASIPRLPAVPAAGSNAGVKFPESGPSSTHQAFGVSEIASDDEDDCAVVGTLLGVESRPSSSGSGRKRARSDVRILGDISAASGPSRTARTTRSRAKAAASSAQSVPETPKSPTSARADTSKPVKRGRRGGHR